jgi:hypothetical protein
MIDEVVDLALTIVHAVEFSRIGRTSPAKSVDFAEEAPHARSPSWMTRGQSPGPFGPPAPVHQNLRRSGGIPARRTR